MFIEICNNLHIISGEKGEEKKCRTQLEMQCSAVIIYGYSHLAKRCNGNQYQITVFDIHFNCNLMQSIA